MSPRPHNDRQRSKIGQRDRAIRVRSIILTVTPADASAAFEESWWALFRDAWPNNGSGALESAPEEERDRDSRTPQS